MGKAKRRRQWDLNYSKKQNVKVVPKPKRSPLTGKEGYLVSITVSSGGELNGFFYYTYEDALKASSILSLTFARLSSDEWEAYFKDEGINASPFNLFPVAVFSLANEIPGEILDGDESCEIIACSQRTVTWVMSDYSHKEGYVELKIPRHGIVPEEYITMMESTNLEDQENPVWSLATVERLKTRKKIENAVIEDWVKSGIDPAFALMNVYHGIQEIIRKNGGWY